MFAIPQYSKYRLKEKIKEANVIVEQVPPETLKENEEKVVKKENFNFENVQEISPTSTFLAANNIDSSLLLGQLVIPSVNMNLPIFKGTTNENLLAGATTMKEGDKMGEGNFSLAGHYNKDKSILFGSLMDVKVGDIIRVTDKVNIYEYEVYDTVIINDTALYMIDDDRAVNRGNNIISLMTCYYSSKTGKRYFVLGDFVKKVPYKKQLMQESQRK
ncbi:sortase family protein [[Eubacterium] yurii subsp. margaretiae ATCC 43715]|nr:sortase family protein [[Eubacterium] yurii subsp. margaretiae ATCC 43715]